MRRSRLSIFGAVFAATTFIGLFLVLTTHQQTDQQTAAQESSKQVSVQQQKPATLKDFKSVINTARSSVVKIEGEACNYIFDATGFIVGQNLVVTNAHAVAGMTTPYVIDANGKHKGTTILFDSNLDIAVIRVGGLAGKPLKLDTPSTGLAIQGSHYGKQAVILGYPNAGAFQAKLVSIGEEYNALTDDIYGEDESEHDMFVVHTKIISGSSGSPVVQRDGTVAGIIFGIDADAPERGLALPTYAFYGLVENTKQLYKPVNTKCTAHDN